MMNTDFNARLSVSEATLRSGGYAHLTIRDEHLIFWVPRGLEPGKCLRIRGHGLVDSGSGRRGDLFVRLESDSPRNDVHRFIKISKDLMKSGGELPLQHNGHSILVRIPPLIENGSRLRLKSSAWFFGHPDNAGDVYLTVAEECSSPTWKEIFVSFGQQAYFKIRLWFAIPPFFGASFEIRAKSKDVIGARSDPRRPACWG